jgi:HEAT repeat protein
VRREAVAVLGYLKRGEALPALMQLATHAPAREVRRAAAGALGLAGDHSVLPALLTLLTDSMWQA